MWPSLWSLLISDDTWVMGGGAGRRDSSRESSILLSIVLLAERRRRERGREGGRYEVGHTHARTHSNYLQKDRHARPVFIQSLSQATPE